MKRRQITAQRLILAFLSKCQKPYIAFSGGKDSLVVLDLVLRENEEVAVVWSDEHWIMPGTLKLLSAIEKHYDIRITRAREACGDREFYTLFQQYPTRPQLREVDYEAEHWKRIVDHFGFDGVILGLRAQESWSRYYNLEKRGEPLRRNKGDGLWHVSPIHDWSTEEVWAYIAGNDLPIHQAYVDMIDAGVEPEYARVGPLTAVRVYQYGILETVKRLWPGLWNEFVAANPCVAEGGY
jgi:phosphoadenosine phosphosulfate reductase